MCLDNDAVWAEWCGGGEASALRPLRLSAAERAAAVSVLRPDALYRAIVDIVNDILGIEYPLRFVFLCCLLYGSYLIKW